MPRIALLLVLFPLAAPADEATLLDDLTFPGRFQLDPWNKAPGEASVAGDELHVGIDWPQGDEFRFFNLQPTESRGQIPYWLKEVSLQVFAGADGHFLEVHFKSTDGKDLKVGWQPKGGAWETLRQPVPDDWVQPLTLTSITWHNWGMKTGGRAEVRLRELSGVIDEKQKLVPGEEQPALLLAPAVPFGLAGADGTAEAAVRMLAWRPLEAAVPLHFVLRDDAGQAVSASDAQLTAEQPARRERVPLPRNGTYRLRVTAAAAAETGLARLPAVPQLTDDERRRSPIGVNTHFGAPWAAFEAMGIHWARDYSWGWLGRGESAPVGNGRDYAAVLADAERHHVQVLPVSMDAFRNAAKTGWNEDSGAIAAGYEKLAQAFPGIPYWEIDNEYEYALRDKGFDLEDYARALLAARDGLQRGGGALLVLNGTAGIRLDQTEVLLKGPAKDTFAVVNSHYYTGTMPPEPAVYDANLGGADRRTPLTFLDQLRLVNRLAHAAGKESWLTEIGWDVTNGPAVGEALQAVYLARAYLLACETGTDKTFWFYDRDVPNAKGIFSTCGLLRLDGSLRPSGVAMAALSAQIARGAYGGSLDLGEDVWALVFKQPAGEWTVAAWSVQTEHPLPKELAGAPAVDLFGNAAQPRTIGPGVSYFRLAQLPPAWERQRQARWESPVVLATSPAAEVGAEASAPGGTLRWAELPQGVTSAGWQAAGERWSDRLQVAAVVAAGRYPLTAEAAGQGWRRSWRVSLLVEPALTVTGATVYEPSQPEILTIASRHLSGPVTVALSGGAGVVAPARFDLAAGGAQRIAVVPDAAASGLLTLDLQMAGGVRRSVTLRPGRLALPKLAGEALGGPLGGWPAEAEVALVAPPDAPAGLSARLGWTANGLRFTVTVPRDCLRAGNPEAFWDFTNVELFVDPAAGTGGWTPSCRQFWFTPAREGEAWRLAAGQWRRVGGNGSAPEPRCRTAVRLEGDVAVLEGFVPADALGQPPPAGQRWRLALSLKAAGPTGAVEAAWPRAKGDGVLAGPRGWGLVGFAP